MLDNYLHRQAKQDVKRQLTAVFMSLFKFISES